MDPAHGKEIRMAGGTWKMAEQHETDKHSSELTALNKENGEQQNNGKNVDFLKEATLVLDLTGNKDIKVEDIIKGILEKVDVDNLLAVRPRRDMEYELTLRSVEVCDGLMDGLEISGQYCESGHFFKDCPNFTCFECGERDTMQGIVKQKSALIARMCS
ncbi:hypothetical protein F2P79_019776 [Pimephales promelas]|nr:hypothetical protein F2P79_019776 [Pimephales promelas]